LNCSYIQYDATEVNSRGKRHPGTVLLPLAYPVCGPGSDALANAQARWSKNGYA